MKTEGRKTDNYKTAEAFIDSNSEDYIHVSREVWENPELSLKEFRAAQIYCDYLEAHGFAVDRGIGGMETAFRARFGNGRPAIGFLAEYDALADMSQKAFSLSCESIHPGAPGHGCGHNMLGAGNLAAAMAVKNYLEDGHEGTVFLYGCPGEEAAASKAFLAREGEWTKLDAALTWHPDNVNEVVSGVNNSCVQVLYRFQGLAAHAASDPFNGRSALDAVELMNIGVQFLREHMTNDCRIHYAIVDAGGVSPNVVQAHAGVVYMVRSIEVAQALQLLERVDKIAQGAALMTETGCERQFIDGTARIVPNDLLEDLLYRHFKRIGVPSYIEEELDFFRELKKTCPTDPAPGIAADFDNELRREVLSKTQGGTRAVNDFLMPLLHTEGFQPGSTDVGDVSWQTPTGQIHVCAFAAGAPGHSWQNVSCGGSTIGDKALLQAGKILACSAIELYENPELLNKIKVEFEERTSGGYVCPIEPDTRPTAL